MVRTQTRTLVGSCMALFVVLASLAARAADPPAASGITTLVPGLVSPRLMGFEKGYVYWVDHPADAQGGPDMINQRLRRVKKEGGAPETLVELEGQEVQTGCGLAMVGDQLLFVLHGRKTGDDRVGRVVAVGKPGSPPVARTSDRPGLCNLFVNTGRLFWTDDAGLWSAQPDGSDPKQLWPAPKYAKIHQVAGRGQNLVVFLSTGHAGAESAQPQGLGSLGRIGHRGEPKEDGAQVVEISPKGKATVLWRSDQPFDGGTVEGGDVLVCAKEGFIRLATNGKKPTRISESCPGAHLWHGWQLHWTVQAIRGAPLTATSLASPNRVVTVFPQMFGPASVIVSDDAAVYMCAAARKFAICDLVRLPGPDWFEHLPPASPEP